MPWPIDDLDLTDLAANSGNLARARSQIYGWQSKLKQTLAANPITIEDTTYYVEAAYNNSTASITYATPNANSFTAGPSSYGAPDPQTGRFAITHNLGIGQYELALYAVLIAPADTTNELLIHSEHYREHDEGIKATFRILDVDTETAIPYTGAADVGILIQVIT